MRHTAVVDESFFENSLQDEAQQHLLRKGDKLAMSMASARHRPSRLPALPIDDFAMREREQGREPTSLALENARLQALLPENLKGTKLPLVIVEPDTPHQPMYRYFEMFGKTRRLATEDMIEELIFDKKRVIATAAGKELIYALDLPDDAGTTIPTKDGTNSPVKFVDAHGVAAQVNPETGMKILHKHMAQRARNIKRQRDVIGRQAEADPPRLRSRIADARVAYFLERWNLRDPLLAHDHPDLFFTGDSEDAPVPVVVDEDAMDIDGEDAATKRAELAAANKKKKKQREEEKREFLERLENAAMHGPLGMLLARHRDKIKDRGTKTGANYFTSSEELGSARLHPSANPDMERIRMKYILSSLEQPRRNERFCPNARECIGYRGNLMRIDNSTYFSPTNSLGVILKEFLTPRQRAHFDLTGELPRKRRLCYLCGLDENTRTVYACQRTGIQPTKPIHTFCVFTNEEGEYANEQCLPVSWRMAAGRQILTGIVDSYPAFNENDYLHDVRHENGVVVRFMRYRPPRAGF